MRDLKIIHGALLGVALAVLTAGTPTLASDAPPASNDDARVGAPPVIVAKPKAATVTAAPPYTNPVPAAPAPTPVAVKAARPVVAAPAPRAVAVTAPPMPVATPRQSPPPMPQQAMHPMPPHGQHAERDGGPDWRGPDGGRDGSRAAYHRPEYGYQLPQEWIAPDYFLGDYDRYGLSRPATGFGWSRYYDDAVLTDQWGRIYDWRDDVNWTDGDSGGNRGDYRDGGSDRGGWDRDGWDRDGRDDRDRDHKKSRGKKYDYKGRWTGSWNGGPEQTYQGAWHGTVRPHWNGDRGGDRGYRGPNYGGGYNGGGYGSSYAYGYDAGGTTVTTVVVQAAAPVMSTRTISYDVVSYVPVRKKVVRRWKPKPRCVCGS
ncbi:hypothetical protein BH09PSE3_BH09PSE3_03490 [soil metagenome]